MIIPSNLPSRLRGVTLIELMVVVVIVAILASISIPGYQRYSQRVKRTDAKAQLMSTAQQFERCYTRDLTYLNCVTFPINVPLEASGTDINYVINTSALTRNTFTLVATRQNSQTRDTECGNFTVNERGVRGVSAGTPADCW